MKYETTPIQVEAFQQQLVSAHVSVKPNGIATANPGDWIVKWPDGSLEVFQDEDFKKKFRVPFPPYVGVRQPLIDEDKVSPWRKEPSIVCCAPTSNTRLEDCDGEEN